MNRLEQIVALLLMTCFATTMTAPTTPPSTTILNSEASMSTESDTLVTRSFVVEQILPATTSSEVINDNEMMKTRLEMTTTNGNLIGTKSQSVATTTENDNGTIKIHEAHESVESSSPLTSQMPPTVKSNLSEAAPSTNASENNKNKSIYGKDFDAVTTTIELPIKPDADNFKIIEHERDFPSEFSVEKKGKAKENRKKASSGTDKKQKLKQKFFADVNHMTIVPTSEPSATAEVYETTHEATISTSIKTAPTTIKSTTLATIKSFQQDSATISSTISAVNFNEMQPTTLPTISTNEQQQQHDNVIVLNSNGSGLIVVDILENFGAENSSSNTTETFEIKMDLIDDVTTVNSVDGSRKEGDKNLKKDDIFLTTIETPSTLDSSSNSSKIDAVSTTTSDDIILININTESTVAVESSSKKIKWNQLKTDGGDGNIKITFDNIDLPNQNINVSIENGELVIDSIDISVLNKAEEEMRKNKLEVGTGERLNKTDSLEIILIEDDSPQDEKEINRDNSVENDESNLTTAVNDERERKINDDDEHLTILSESANKKHDRLKKIELGEGQEDGEEDGIKIKSTDKDSDTIFYISNTEVKVIESIPTNSPGAGREKKYYPAIYEEDVIVDVPNKNRTAGTMMSDKYEEDIVLSPLTSDFDPKDINYIGEAFLDVEESQNVGGYSENHHIIPLTSDVVIQPVQLRNSPRIGIPIIGELPPQIELEEMVFSDDYDSKQQQSNFRVEEYFPNFLTNRLVKNQLDVDVPKELVFDSKNSTLLPNRTHISINTVINGTNMTTISSSFPNATALLLDSDENETAGKSTGRELRGCFEFITIDKGGKCGG